MNVLKKCSRLACLILALLLTAGCADPSLPETAPAPATLPAVTEEPPLLAGTGEASSLSCQGSYTGTPSSGAIVARMQNLSLSALELQGYYSLALSAHRGFDLPQPDWSQALDRQLCDLDRELTWQQYFLGQAVELWHTWTALELASREAEFPLDPEYRRNQEDHDQNIAPSMPAARNLYGYETGYAMNSLHAAYLDRLPQALDQTARDLGYEEAADLAHAMGCSLDTLLAVAGTMNRAYFFFTWQRWLYPREEAAPTASEADGDWTVTFRQLLLAPEEDTERSWKQLQLQANKLFQKEFIEEGQEESDFARMANHHSLDQGSRLDGGRYTGISRGQVHRELDSWLFDPARQPGDTTQIQTELGLHVLYFCGRESAAGREEAAAAALTYDRDRIRAIADQYPMLTDYRAAALADIAWDCPATVEALLYPDIAHEHIPEPFVYLQQDFPDSDYGAWRLAKSGCGATTLAMLASYMTDHYHTPPQIADTYARYKGPYGTDGRLMADSAWDFGYYWVENVFSTPKIVEALDRGNLVVNLQVPGYFTQNGHYLLLWKLHEDGAIAIRDSNIFNYGSLPEHQQDRFPSQVFTPCGVQSWVFEPKITRIPACSRCGEETGLEPPEGLLLTGYTCHLCTEALLRKEAFLPCQG